MTFRIVIFFLFYNLCNAQNQTSKWYFGQNAGLSFLTNPPTPIATSAMNATEGCASIADASGNTLFYTDGSTLYNQQDLVMANGTGLFGSTFSAQSALIVKQPGNNSIYYVFTLGANAQGSLCCTTVDMALATGSGSVTVKNAFLYAPCTEHLAGVKHCNGVDVWVITHEFNSNNFRSYLVTASGVSTVPVISSVGNSINLLFGQGQLKFSQNGKKLGMGLANPGKFNLYDFDPGTGIVSNELVLATGIGNAYGCEFSSDGTKFYGGRGGVPVIYQWDLCAGNNAAVVASQYSIATTSFTGAALGAGGMQLAQDGKIYISRPNTQTLSVINNANVGGPACNYVDLGFSIAPGTCKTGLPCFIAGFLTTVMQPFTSSIIACQSLSFSAAQNQTSCTASPYAPSGFLWNFGEPSSGPANTSTVQAPVHLYASPGSYTSQLIVYYPCRNDTLTQAVVVPDTRPAFSLTGNTNICKKETTTLTAIATASQGSLSYTWSPGTSTIATATVSPTTTTIYSVTVQNLSGCLTSKTIQVTVNPCTGIYEQRPEALIHIYPNPNDGVFYFDTRLENFSYTIYNQLGIVVSDGIAETDKKNVEAKELPNGLYFVEVKNADVKKLMKFVKSD